MAGADTDLIPDFDLQPVQLLKGGVDALTSASDARKSGDAGYVYTIDRHADPDVANSRELTVAAANGTVDGTAVINTITWHELDMTKDQVFRTRIKVNTSGTASIAEDATKGDILTRADGVTDGRDEAVDGVYPFYTSLDTLSDPTNGAALEDDDDADLYAVRSKNVDVAFNVLSGTALLDHVTYSAASKQSIIFRFEADNTSIKGGQVSFNIPRAAGWSTPIAEDTKKVKDGEVTATIDKDGTVGDGAATKIAAGEIKTGRQVTITVDALPQGGHVDVTYSNAVVQYTADTVDFIGEFKASPADRLPRRAGRVEVEITNVADGSGSATISTGTSPAHTARAGSTDNKITVKFTAPGSMGGGQVALELPSGWGGMQADNDDEPNYIKVEAGSGGTLDSSTPAYVGRDVVVANLEDFEKDDTVTFTYGYGSGDESGAEAPSEIGVGEFVVSSAGARDGQLEELGGDAKRPDDKEEDELLGKIYWIEAGGDKDAFDRGTDIADGALRIKVVSAADGTGTAQVEIRDSSSPTGKYGIDAAGETDADAVTQQVHAGDDSIWLLFTYIPGETIRDGELRFTVPTGWTIPQEDDQGEAGYTYFNEVGGASIGSPDIPGDSRTITVEIIEMTKNDAIEIHYGWRSVRDGGAEAPKVAETGTFGFQIKGSEDGSPDSLRSGSPTVKVREAASGSGTAEISPLSAGAADMETITITYTAVGEIEDGALRLEVPDKWSDASSDNISVRGGGGSADYGRDYYEYGEDGETLEAKADKPDHTPTLLQVVYSGISLAAGGEVVFTYSTQVGATIGDHTFKLEFQGGEGPGLDAKDPTKGFGAVKDADGGDLIVKVGEAAAGTGELEDPMHDAIQAGDTDAEITFIYTAAGAINYPGTFAVRVPTGWGDSDYTVGAGDYTVTYEDADGNLLRGTQESVEEVAPKDLDMLAKIKGANSPTITAGHRVVFTYTSDAPATAGPYDFTVLYDDVVVGDVTVNVLSAEEATTVELASSASLDGTETPVAITISLIDDTGTAATMSSSFSVELASDVATGRFSDSRWTVRIATDNTMSGRLLRPVRPG